MSRFARFRRGRRLKALRQRVRLPFAERMARLKPQPRKPAWWAMLAGVVALCGMVGWALV